MSCSKYPLIKINDPSSGGGRGPQGPPGPQGPQGPPGEGVHLPLNSQDVDYRGTDLQSILDDLLYVPLAINSFSLTPSVVEMGNTVTSVTTNWSYNKAVESQKITGPSTDLSLPISDRQRLITGLSITSSTSFTLEAFDGNNTVTRNASLQVLNGVYWGASVPGSYNSTFIRGLSGKELRSNRNKTFTVTAGLNQKIYYAYPKRFGTAIFESGGFEGGFKPLVTVSFTNIAGYTEDYYLGESDQLGLGTTTITVK